MPLLRKELLPVRREKIKLGQAVSPKNVMCSRLGKKHARMPDKIKTWNLINESA